MSRLPRGDRGYQPLPGQGLPTAPTNLFDRRTDRYNAPPQEPADYRRRPQNMPDQYGMDRRSPAPIQNSPGFLSRSSGQGQDSGLQRGRILRVAKVCITSRFKLIL